MWEAENVNFFKLYFLLITAGGEVLRQIILRGLERQKVTLGGFLKGNRESICNLERIKQSEINILYPTPEVSDLSKWDISLLCCIVLNYFKNDLNDPELNAVEKMKKMRNTLAHQADASIEFNTYSIEWTNLTLMLYTVSYEMDKSKKDYIVQLISDLAKPFDIRLAIDELKTSDRIYAEQLLRRVDEIKDSLDEVKSDVAEVKAEVKGRVGDVKVSVDEVKNGVDEVKVSVDEVNDGVDEVKVSVDEVKDGVGEVKAGVDGVKDDVGEVKVGLGGVKDGVDEIKDEISKMKRKIEEISKLKQEIQELKELMENRGKSTDITNKSRGAIHVSAEDQDIETAAQSLLISAATDSASSSSHGTVKEKVDKLVEEIKGTGAGVEEVTTGSVVFSFECSSIKSLLDLIDFFESPNMQNHLDEISAVLGDILGHKIDLTAHMLTESLQDVVKKLKSMTEKRGRSLQFSMTCRGVEGLQHALDVFEGDAASISLNDLTKTLSEEVGKPVTIETSIDIEEMQKAIQTTKQKIENELRDIQDSGVETIESESGTVDEFHESEVLNATFCSGQLEDGSICNQLSVAAEDGCETCVKICSPHSRKKCAQQTESEACSEFDRKLEAEDSDIQTEKSSVIKSSDMLHDFVCTPCSEDGRSTEAFKYCVECQSYFCKSCLQQHSKFPPLKKHILLDKADIEGATRQDKTKLPVFALPSDFCSDHPGNITQLYCRNHDVVCCTVCIALHHRSCEGMEYIPKIATKESLGGKERIDVETAVEEIWRELYQVKQQIEMCAEAINNAK